jgi:hypothetical protein
MLTRFTIIAACALIGPAYAGESMADAKSNFEAMCEVRDGSPSTLHEICGVSIWL